MIRPPACQNELAPALPVGRFYSTAVKQHPSVTSLPAGDRIFGTKWEDLPEDFECPLCMVDKDNFSAE